MDSRLSFVEDFRHILGGIIRLRGRRKCFFSLRKFTFILKIFFQATRMTIRFFDVLRSRAIIRSVLVCKSVCCALLRNRRRLST